MVTLEKFVLIRFFYV